MEPDNKIIRDTLRDILLSYRSSRPNLSLRSIARNAGVNRYFLTKVLEETETTKFDFDQILAFCKFMQTSESMNENIKVQIEEILNYLLKYFPTHPYNKADELLMLDNQEVDMYDRCNFLILLLACCDKGFTRDRIVSIIGENSRGHIEQLIKNKTLIEEEDGTVFLRDKQNLYIPIPIIRYHLAELARFYQVKHRGKDRNFIQLLVQGLNSEGLKKIVAIQVKNNENIKTVIRDKKYWGKNPAFIFSCLDTFTDEVEE